MLRLLSFKETKKITAGTRMSTLTLFADNVSKQKYLYNFLSSRFPDCLVILDENLKMDPEDYCVRVIGDTTYHSSEDEWADILYGVISNKESELNMPLFDFYSVESEMFF